MVGWDIEGMYMGIRLSITKNDRGSPTFSTTHPRAPPDYFRSASSISQSKYCLKACNFRII